MAFQHFCEEFALYVEVHLLHVLELAHNPFQQAGYHQKIAGDCSRGLKVIIKTACCSQVALQGEIQFEALAYLVYWTPPETALEIFDYAV